MSPRARTAAPTTLLAALLAILVMTAPVAADHTTLLVSQHSTDTEFNAAETLRNVTVEGSGASANVTLEAIDNTVDSFEDADLSEYSGDTADWSTPSDATSTAAPTDGTLLLESDPDSGPIISTSGLPRYYPKDSGNYSVDVNLSGTNRAEVWFGVQDLNNVYSIHVEPNQIRFVDEENGGEVTRETVPANVPLQEWLVVEIEFETDSNAIGATVRERDSGTIVAGLERSASKLDSNEGSGIGFNANESGVKFDYARISSLADKKADGTYISQNHTTPNAAEGYTNLTLTNAEAQVTWQGSNGNTWTDLASATYSTSGNRSLDIADGYADYRVNVTFVRQSGATTAKLHDEGVLATNHAPEINTSSLSPADGASLNSRSVTLEGEVRDANFADGESVEVNFTVNGSVVDTQTIGSNQTVSTTVSVSGGEHTWSLAAEDTSHTTDTTTRTFSTPGIIRVYDGDVPTDLLDHQTIDAEFIGTSDTSNFQETRSTTNGTFPLGGLPDEELRVRLNATDYGERVLILASPSETRETIMYNLTNSATFEQCFTLDSRGAGFAPDETKLVIQAYINGQWQDATGKYFGAANLACAYLEDGENYRLKVTDGENTRNLGGYEADQSFANDVITLVVEGVTFGLDRGEDYRWQAELTNESGSPEIQFKLDSRDQALEDLEITIWERGNPPNVLTTVQESGPVGVYSANFPLTNDQATKEWVVNWTAEYPDGTIATGQTIVSLATAQSTLVPAGAPPDVILGLVIGLVILLAMVFGGELTAPVGMVITVGFAGLLSLLGVLDIPEDVLMLAIGLAVVGYIGIGVFGR